MLNQDYRDILLCLREERVDFIIVGAYALAAHGNIRATGDIDVWVRSTEQNAESVLRALARFGAPISKLTVDDLTARDSLIQIGQEPCRIDILTGIDGVAYDEGWSHRVTVAVDGIEVFVLSKADLLKNKLAANRDKDQSDIAWLRVNQDPGS